MKKGILKTAAIFFMAFVVFAASGMSAQLAHAVNFISGTVTNAQGQGVANIYVLVYPANNSSSYSYYPLTAADGTYTVSNVTAGQYKIRFYPYSYYSNSYVEEWYNNKASHATAEIITVIDGVPVTGIDAVLAKPGAIAGLGLDGSGAPIPNISVDVFNQAGTVVQSATTAADGSYTLGNLPPDVSYKVRFSLDFGQDRLDGWFDNKTIFSDADNVTVPDDNTTRGIDVRFAGSGSIAGRVTDFLSQGIEGVEVMVCNYDYLYTWRQHGYTDSNGYYNVRGLPAGLYKVYFGMSGLTGIWYNGSPYSDMADTVAVLAGQTTQNIDAQLAAPGAISGYVTDAAGTSIESVTVRVYDQNGRAINTDSTDTDGAYAFSNLPAGTYKVRFSLEYLANDVIQWYDNDTSFQTATAVTVIAGKTSSVDMQFKQCGSISGTVTDAVSKVGLESIYVYVYSQSSSSGYIRYATTDSFGAYSINGLPPGSYKVRFYPYYYNSYGQEWYCDQTSFASAGVVTVDYGHDTPGINGELTAPGSIAGRVKDSTDTGISGLYVYLYTAADSDSYYTYDYTDGTGAYNFNDLPAGDYKVFVPGTSTYLGEWYEDKYDFSTAETVTVVGGEAITGKDFSLTKTGGTDDFPGDCAAATAVTLGSTRNGVIEAPNDTDYFSLTLSQPTTVVITLSSTTSSYVYLYVYDSTCANQIGYTSSYYSYNNTLTLTLNAGTYKLKATSSGTGRYSVRIAQGATISGTVTKAGGTGISSVYVDLYRYDAATGLYNYYDEAYTASNGTYTLSGLPAGTYKVNFITSTSQGYLGEWYNDKAAVATADPITLTAGQTFTANAELSTGGGISGTVTKADGGGIGGAYVYVYDQSGNYVKYGYTDSAGAYTISGLPAGLYSVRFYYYGYVEEYYNDKPSNITSDIVTVAAGVITTGINARLAKLGVISGKVANAAAQNIQNAYVYAYSMNNSSYSSSAYTNSSGNYSIAGLAAGTYEVKFTPPSGSNYNPEWYNNKPDREQATPVTVALDNTTANINAVLEQGGAITGLVTTEGGAGISNIQVNIYDSNADYFSYVYTKDNGTYTAVGLPTGVYKVVFNSNSDYFGEWYNNKAGTDTADTVSVTAGQTTSGIDASLAGGGSISGKVTNAQGLGISYIEVYAYQNCNDAGYSYTDSNGNYKVRGLKAGAYKVQFWETSTYYGKWYDNKADCAKADAISVTSGKDTPDKNAVLAAKAVTTTSSISTTSTTTIPDDFGDNCSTAQTVTVGSSTSGALEVAGDKDVFSLTLTETESVVIYTTGSTDTYGSLYSGLCSLLAQYSDDDSGPGNNFLISADLGPGTYYIEVKAYNTSAYGPYTLHVARPGSIAGRVSYTGTGITGLLVSVEDYNTGAIIGEEYTGIDGVYEVDSLPPGAYKVLVTDEKGIYVDKWYNNALTPVTVNAGQQTAGIDIQLTVSSTGSTTSSVPVTPPAPNFYAVPASGDFPLRVQFYNTTTGMAKSWFWDFGDGDNSTEKNPAHVYYPTSSGTDMTYYVTLKAKGYDNIEYVSGEVAIQAILPAARVDFYAVKTNQAPGKPVQFVDNSTGYIEHRHWEFGYGDNSTDQKYPQHSYDSENIYNVSLTISGTLNNAPFTKKTVRYEYITIDHNFVNAQFSANPTWGYADLKVDFTDHSDGSAGQWFWNFGDGSTGTGANPVHTYTVPGVYSVMQTVISSIGNFSDSYRIPNCNTVNPNPAYYKLTGKVRGDVSEGIQVYLTDAADTTGLQGRSVPLKLSADSKSGTYSFMGLKAGQYRVTPYFSNTAFEAASQVATVTNGSVTLSDFTAKAVGPQVSQGTVWPYEIYLDNETQTTFYVQVKHPAGPSGIASVTLDASSLGLDNQSMSMNDQDGDSVYSRTLPVEISGGKIGPRLVHFFAEDIAGLKATTVARVDIKGRQIIEVSDVGAVYTPIVNDIEGQTLVVEYYVSDNTTDNCTWLQILDPDNATYLEEESAVSRTLTIVEIPNAAKGAWSVRLRKSCSGQQAVSRRGSASVMASSSSAVSVSSSISGTGVLFGMIVDAVDGSPESSALVKTNGGTQTYTNQGFYCLLQPAGSFVLDASKPAHQTVFKSVSVASGTDSEINITMPRLNASTTTTSTTTTSTPGGTTTTISPGGTTTTSIAGKTKCPLAKAMNERAKPLGMLRQFRDSVMAKTEKGREYVELYYTHGAEITEMLAGDASLRLQVTEAALESLPVVKRALKGDAETVLPKHLLLTFEEIAGRIQARAGPELREAIAAVLADMQSDVLLEQLGLKKKTE